MNAMASHLAAINGGTVTKTQVIGIRKAINHVERIRAGFSGNRSNATAEELFEIEKRLRMREPIVTGELHTSGLKLLRDPRYAKRFDERQRCVIEASDAHFQLVRYDRCGRRGEYAVPVYRIIGGSGNFLFRNIAWQSGGVGPEIVPEEY